MNLEDRTKIADAMTSGKYTQVKGMLRSSKSENCFCAVGLSIAILEPSILWVRDLKYEEWGLTDGEEIYYGDIVNDTPLDFSWLNDREESFLMHLNDNFNYSFYDISLMLRQSDATWQQECKKLNDITNGVYAIMTASYIARHPKIVDYNAGLESRMKHHKDTYEQV